MTQTRPQPYLYSYQRSEIEEIWHGLQEMRRWASTGCNDHTTINRIHQSVSHAEHIYRHWRKLPHLAQRHEAAQTIERLQYEADRCLQLWQQHQPLHQQESGQEGSSHQESSHQESSHQGSGTIRPSSPHTMNSDSTRPPPKRPRIIMIEGPDGSGKSTLSEMLGEALQQLGIHITRFREPNDSGDITARKWLRTVQNDHQVALLMQLSRITQDQSIHEALQQPGIIIKDRGWPSTWAYQKNISDTELEAITNFGRDTSLDQETILLAITRGRRNGLKEGIRDENDLDFTPDSAESVNTRYLRLIDTHGSRFNAVLKIDCWQPPEETLQIALNMLLPLL